MHLNLSLSNVALVVIIASLAIAPVTMQPQFAFAQTCIETASCEITEFFEFVLFPYKLQFGEGWAYLIVWGLVIAVIWLRTRNFMMTTLVGIYVGGLLMAGPALTEASVGFNIAVILASIAIGIALYYLYKHRLQNPY